MKASDLRKKGASDLRLDLTTAQRELFDLRFKQNKVNEDSQVLRTHNVRLVRRQIARIKTILNEKIREAHE